MGTPGGFQVRVAVIGATATGEEFDLRNPPLHPAVCFTDPIPKVIAIYDQVKNIEKADVTVLITHQGYEVDLAMAQALIDAGTPIDIIIGGHTHTYLEAPTMVGDTYVVQADFYGRDIGVFDLIFDRSTRELTINWSQHFFTPTSPDDPEILAFVQKIKPTRTPDKQVTGTPVPEGTYLIDLSPIEVSVAYDYMGEGVFPFWGDGFVNGQRLESNGVKYLDGLFANAPSSITYSLDGQYSRFISSILVKDTTYCSSAASFSVFLDDVVIFQESGVLSWSDPKFLDLDVTSGQRLRLETLPANDYSCDWTIWGNPYLVR